MALRHKLTVVLLLHAWSTLPAELQSTHTPTSRLARTQRTGAHTVVGHICMQQLNARQDPHNLRYRRPTLTAVPWNVSRTVPSITMPGVRPLPVLQGSSACARARTPVLGTENCGMWCTGTRFAVLLYAGRTDCRRRGCRPRGFRIEFNSRSLLLLLLLVRASRWQRFLNNNFIILVSGTAHYKSNIHRPDDQAVRP